MFPSCYFVSFVVDGFFLMSGLGGTCGPRLSTWVTPASNHLQDYGRTLSYRTCTGNFVSVEFKLEVNHGSQTREVVVNSTFKASPEDGLLTGKVVHLALPVRWSPVGQE